MTIPKSFKKLGEFYFHIFVVKNKTLKSPQLHLAVLVRRDLFLQTPRSYSLSGGEWSGESKAGNI